MTLSLTSYFVAPSTHRLQVKYGTVPLQTASSGITVIMSYDMIDKI